MQRSKAGDFQWKKLNTIVSVLMSCYLPSPFLEYNEQAFCVDLSWSLDEKNVFEQKIEQNQCVYEVHINHSIQEIISVLLMFIMNGLGQCNSVRFFTNE